MKFWPAAAILVTAFAACGGLVVGQGEVGASTPGPQGRDQPIIGNVVGNNSPADRTTLGSDASGCTATVEAGLGGHHYGAPVVHHYTIPGLSNFVGCPDMGVSVRRPHAGVDDLVVTWFIKPSGPTDDVYVLRHLSQLSGGNADIFPNYLGTQDFNGDRRGDVWESTDELGGFTTYLRQGRGFVPGPASFYNTSALPSIAFGHLDNTPGTDIAAGYSSKYDQPGLSGSAGTGALVVFGGTGRIVLLEHDATRTTQYQVAILDADGDGHLDVRVSDGTGEPRVYLGDGMGGFRLSTTAATR